MYSTHNDEPRTFINDIPTEEPSFDAIINHIKEDENMTLKKQVFIGWIDFNGIKSVQKREFVMQI